MYTATAHMQTSLLPECAPHGCLGMRKVHCPGCVHVLTPSLLPHASTRQQSFGWSSSPHPVSPSAHRLQWFGSLTSHCSSTQWGSHVPTIMVTLIPPPPRPAAAGVHGSGWHSPKNTLTKGVGLTFLNVRNCTLGFLYWSCGTLADTKYLHKTATRAVAAINVACGS